MPRLSTGIGAHGTEKDVHGPISRVRRNGRFATLAGGWLVAFLLVSFACVVSAEQRFPPPEFETGHQLPVTSTPPARALLLQYLDVLVLAGSLGVATWLVYSRRSRKLLVGLSIFSVAYFGFYRKGCVCSIGSLQNVALALCDRDYAVPLSVVVFFALPLVFALFGGRTFCAGVCPHGALQDLVLLKPIAVPPWLEQGLSVLPFVYLGAGVLFAATGSAFLICQYDPFVPIFRMNGRVVMVGAGIALLLLGTVVGRPYCRFLCPYGALLKLAAMAAKWRVRVTPNVCTQCRLCEASCPFGAMRKPEPVPADEPHLARDRRRLAWLLLLLPCLAVGGGWLGHLFSAPASLLHPSVQLADRYVRENDKPSPYPPQSPEALSLERARQSSEEILNRAAVIRQRFSVGGWILGAWIGLVVGVKLLGLSIWHKRSDFEPSRGDCFACARCFDYCPNELIRRGQSPLPLAQNENALQT